MPNMGVKADFPIPDSKTSLANALFTTTQQRVFGQLFGRPDRSFYATEIIGLTGSGSGAVQRELARLAQSGLVIVSRIGNQKHYQANPDSPLFAELCGIVEKTVGLVEPIRKALEPLSKNIDLAFIYGSVAGRKDTAASDIDLMVVSDHLTYAEVFSTLEEVTLRLNRPINPTIYSKEEYNKRISDDNVFLKRVISLPKLWVIGGENDIAIG